MAPVWSSLLAEGVERVDKTKMEPEKLIPILEELRELLLKYDFVDHATTIAELIDLAHLDSPDFVRELQSGEVWGSAGSIADLVFQGNVEGPEEQIRADDLHYAKLLLGLAEEMVRRGIGTEEILGFDPKLMRKAVDRREGPQPDSK